MAERNVIFQKEDNNKTIVSYYFRQVKIQQFITIIYEETDNYKKVNNFREAFYFNSHLKALNIIDSDIN